MDDIDRPFHISQSLGRVTQSEDPTNGKRKREIDERSAQSEGSRLPETSNKKTRRESASPFRPQLGDNARPDAIITENNDLEHHGEVNGVEDSIKREIKEESDDEPQQDQVKWSEYNESYPDCAAYHQSLQYIGPRFRGAWTTIKDVLKRNISGNAAVERLLIKVVEIPEFPVSPTPKIALIGPAGVGKSSLINCVLDIRKVAKQGSSGASCTTTIVEYQKCFPGQTGKFAAMVRCFSSQQIEELLRGYLADYIHFECEEDFSKWTQKEKQEYRSEAATAEETFLALFCTKNEFSSRAAIKQTIKRAFKTDSVPVMLLTLKGWCNDLISTNNLTSETTFIQADTTEKLHKLLKPLLASNFLGGRKSSLWPIVERVIVGIRDTRVLQNLVIVDFPGISDINIVRARGNQAYLRECDALWIVAPISRCVTDNALDETLQEYGERFRGRLAIICTKTDEIGDQDDLADEIEDDSGQYQSYKRKVLIARLALQQAQKAGSPQVIARCQRQLQDRVNQKFEYLVELRNRLVREQLYETKADCLQKGDLEIVHCVSNKLYLRLKGDNDAEDRMAPELSAAATGIPGLREFALRLPSQGIWDGITGHIRLKSRGLLQYLDIWANMTDTGSDAGTMNGCVQHQENVSSILQEYKSALAAQTKKLLISPIKSERDSLGQSAEAYLQSIRAWSYMTIKAFVNKDGTHTTPAVGAHSWDTEMMKAAAEIIDKTWPELTTEEQQRLDLTQQEILKKLDAISNDLSGPLSSMGLPVKQLQRFITTKKGSVEKAIKDQRKKADKNFRNIRYSATKHARDSYFSQAMCPAYEKARNMSGTGYKAMVIAHFCAYVSTQGSGSPFRKMAASTEADVLKTVDANIEDLEPIFCELIEDIYQFISSLVGLDDADEGAAVLETKLALQEVLPAVNRELQSIDNELDKIQASSRH